MYSRKLFIGFYLLIFFSANLLAQDISSGVRLIRSEKLAEAKKYFISLLGSKTSSEACFYLGEIFFQQQNLDSAKLFYEKGIEADKKFPLNYVGLVRINVIEGNSTQAEKNQNEAIDLGNEKNPEVYVVLSKAYSRIKEYKKAIELLNNALKISTQHVNTYLALGKVYLEENNGTEAVKNFQKAIDVEPTNTEALTWKAKVYILINNYQSAISLLDEAIKNVPSFAPAYVELAELYYTMKNYSKAAENYSMYLANSEVTLEKKKRYAQILYLNKEYQKAIDILKEVNKIEPNNSSSVRIIAYSYLRLEDTENSMSYFQKFFEIPSAEFSATDYENYADLLSKTGNDSLAIENYAKSLSLDSSKIELHSKMASLYFKNKKYSEAAKEYFLKERLTGKKLSLREYFDLGTALTVSGQFVEADSIFGEITKIKPDLPLGYLMRARVQSTVDSTQELGFAKPYYEKFIEVVSVSPDSTKYQKDLVEANSYLGYHYFLMKDDPAYKDIWRENYKKYWEKVLELEPENQQAKDALEGLKKIK